jgi:hypothetical protein
MSEKLVATLTIPFDSEDGIGDNAGKNRIVLKQVTKRLGPTGVLVAWCFPARGVSFRASVGSVETKESRVWPSWEAIKFSDSSEGQLKYPGATSVSINTDTMVLMRKTEDNYGNTVIQPATGVQVRWNDDEEKVVVETSLGERVKVYGACFVQYDAPYRVLYYSPNIQETPVGGSDVAFSWSVGTIFGYNNYTVATLDMELDISDPPEWVEFARVTSKIVLTAAGVFEYPPNWEDTHNANKNIVNPANRIEYNTGKFPGFSTDYDIEPDESFTDERVHCIVKVNTVGMLQYEDFNNGGDGYWAWNTPYFGYSTYDPKYECKWVDPPGGKKASSAEDFKHDLNNRTWRDVFLEVDKDVIKEKFNDEYPDVTYSGN